MKLTIYGLLIICAFSCSRSVNTEASYEQKNKVISSHIDGGSDEVLKKYQDLLNGVVKISNDVTSCTATLIAKDILITAAHCVQEISAGTMKIQRSNSEYVEVQIKEVTKSATTDIGFIKFASSQMSDKFFEKTELIPISLNNNMPIYDGSEVLLSGYGDLDNVMWTDSLRAGMNYIADGNANLKSLLDRVLNELKLKTEEDKNQFIHILSQREFHRVRSFYPANDGKPKLFDALKQHGGHYSVKAPSANNAVIRPGDSGGPLIAFKNNQPYIIGIHSSGSNSILVSEVGKVIIRCKEPGLEHIMGEVIADIELIQKFALDNELIYAATEQGKTVYYMKKYFQYEFDYTITGIGLHSATDYPDNSKFITESLKKLSQ